MTDIVLNLKGIVCRMHSDATEVEAPLVVTGPGEITAKDIDLPAGVEILNPDVHVATLDRKTKLELYLTIGRGRGYRHADEDKSPTADRHHPDDSIFSPVQRVAYASRAPRRPAHRLRQAHARHRDRRVDDPTSSLREAAEILISQLAIFTDPDRIDELRAGPGGALTAATAPSCRRRCRWTGCGGPMHDILIEELELGVRSYNCLKRAGIQTVGDLISKSEGELNAIPNFGKKSIDEVIETLGARGLTPRRLTRIWLPMRHQKTRHKLSRDAAHRKALLANLCKEVIQHERIKTTEAKAKAVKPEIEKLITLAKRGDLHARRQALGALGQDKFTVYKLFDEVAPRYVERNGGYTRILKLGPRPVGLPRRWSSSSWCRSVGGAPRHRRLRSQAALNGSPRVEGSGSGRQLRHSSSYRPLVLTQPRRARLSQRGPRCTAGCGRPTLLTRAT